MDFPRVTFRRADSYGITGQQPLFSLPPPDSGRFSLAAARRVENGNGRTDGAGDARRSLWVLTFLSSNQRRVSPSVSPSRLPLFLKN